MPKHRLKYALARKSSRSLSSRPPIYAEIDQGIDDTTLPASVSSSFLNASFPLDDCTSSMTSGEAFDNGGEISVPCSHVSCTATFASVSALNLHNYSVHGFPGLFQ